MEQLQIIQNLMQKMDAEGILYTYKSNSQNGKNCMLIRLIDWNTKPDWDVQSIFIVMGTSKTKPSYFLCYSKPIVTKDNIMHSVVLCNVMNETSMVKYYVPLNDADLDSGNVPFAATMPFPYVVGMNSANAAAKIFRALNDALVASAKAFHKFEQQLQRQEAGLGNE